MLFSEGMEALLRAEFKDENLKCLGMGGSGCISEGLTYETGNGEKMFVKVNNKAEVQCTILFINRKYQCTPLVLKNYP